MKYLGKIQDNKDLVTKEYVDNKANVITLEGTYTNPDILVVQKTPIELYNYLGAGTVVYIKGIYDNEDPYYRQRTNSLYRLNSFELQGDPAEIYRASITSHSTAIIEASGIALGTANGYMRDTSITFALTPMQYAQTSSPAFTGNPTAPTQAAGNNSTRLATTAFVQTAIANIDTDSANATNSTSKLFLIGATSQTASPDTYSNSDVYGTNGTLNAKSFSVDASANIVYNSSAKSIDFTFV